MDEELEYEDFLESGAYVKKLEETYNRYLDIRDKKLVEFMKENKRLHSIIKEVREYTNKYFVLGGNTYKEKVLEILDKDSDKEVNEDFDKYLVIANHDIQRANNMKELKSYVASILYEMDNLEDRLRQKENLIKEVREYIEHNIVDYITNYDDLREKLLEILDKEI